MKKKIILGAVFVLLAGAAVFGVLRWRQLGLTAEKVFALPAANGSFLYYSAAGGVVRMTDMTKGQRLFEGLEEGDECLVVHGLTLESFPGQTGVYWLRVLSHTADAIPPEVKENLREMGWLAPEPGQTAQAHSTKPAVLTAGGFTASLDLPEDWTVQPLPADAAGYDPSCAGALTVSPAGGGSFTLTCFPAGGFSVCGTGLTTQALARHEGVVGYYDGEPLWNYALIHLGQAQLVAVNEGMNAVDAAAALAAIEAGSFSAAE